MNNSISSSTGPRTLTQAAYHQLRRDIVAGKLAPGSRLRVEHLKDDYQVGAGTLREALALLVADALVVQHGQRGFRVMAISLEDFLDITATRVLLETAALRQAIDLGDDNWEGDLASAYHRLSLAEDRLELGGADSFSEWEERNRAFHEVLISACPSHWQHHFLDILYRQSERYRRLSISYRPIPRDVHAEHHAIFEATMARDADRACQLLTEHINATLDAIQNLPAGFFNGGVDVAVTGSVHPGISANRR